MRMILIKNESPTDERTNLFHMYICTHLYCNMPSNELEYDKKVLQILTTVKLNVPRDTKFFVSFDIDTELL